MNLLSLIFGICLKGFTLVAFQGTDYCVSNDYYQINEVRIPMSLTKLEKLLDNTGMSLPSIGLVDEIYKQSRHKLKPIPLDIRIYSRDFLYHDYLIDKQLGGNKGLVAGHKKDLIKVPKGSQQVLIYGWHKLNGVPIQPPSRTHHREYWDYSHGIRLVYKRK